MEEIKEYTLRNSWIEVSFINLGASITKFIDLESGINIIKGYDNYEDYRKNRGSMNCVIGRHAGRITDFYLDDNYYEVTKNVRNLYQLHGGFNGFHVQFFDTKVSDEKITFSLVSPDGADGYPGEVHFKITYQLVENELHLLYEAVSTRNTIMSFTNHAYFNLSGHDMKSILDHELYINADHFIELDENLIPKKKTSLKNTPLDFSQLKPIGQDINHEFQQLKITGGYDHPYLITKRDGVTHVASLISPESTLRLDVFSDQDVVVLYTGNFMNDTSTLNNGIKGFKHQALCLESQGIPNSVNIEEFKNRNIYKANEVYQQTTIWKLHR